MSHHSESTFNSIGGNSGVAKVASMTPKAIFRVRGTWLPEKTGIVRMRPLALTITNTQTEMDWVAVIAQPTIWGICSMTERVNSIMVRTIQGSITTMSESTAKALGTNDSVCS